ncbi:hypothetical protein [Streptomyces sp. NRRL WC-3549]|nr:hypothetical protein [Streptomyces sp. NRRL WC-3549]
MSNRFSLPLSETTPYVGALVLGVILIAIGMDAADVGVILAALTPVYAAQWVRADRHGDTDDSGALPNGRASGSR